MSKCIAVTKKNTQCSYPKVIDNLCRLHYKHKPALAVIESHYYPLPRIPYETKANYIAQLDKYTLNEEEAHQSNK